MEEKEIRIKMICGTYGFRGQNGIMEEKNNKSEPFEVEEQEGRRLITMGYAVEIKKKVKPPEEELDDEEEEAEPEEKEADSFMEELGQMGKKDLEKIAKDMGLSATGTKNDLIQRIIESEEERRKNEEGMPKLAAAEPEE